MKKESIIFIGIIISALIVGSAIYFKPTAKNPNANIFIDGGKSVILDIQDREKGICADMYKQGYEWGLGQIPLQVGIWRFEGKSENSIKELLYDMLKNWHKENN